MWFLLRVKGEKPHGTGQGFHSLKMSECANAMRCGIRMHQHSGVCKACWQHSGGQSRVEGDKPGKNSLRSLLGMVLAMTYALL